MKDRLFKDMLLPRIQLYGQKCAIIEGFKSIKRFERESIELECKGCDIVICGFDMELREKSRGYIEVRGTILDVKVVGNNV